MQTILGSGGAIGVPLAKELKKYTSNIRLVSRSPKKVNESDELFAADLTRPEEVLSAVEGSSVVYVTVGFAYNRKVWKKTWPLFIESVIAACKVHQAKLVFFDNMYLYDPNHLGKMTEETPVNPCSKKGEIRAAIAQRILDEVNKGLLTALIARSADFYGPEKQHTGLLTETVIKPFSKKKKANWMGADSCKHSFTYTPDAAKATALLGNTPDAYNQVWHLPTASGPLNGKEWIELIGKEMNVRPKYQVVPKWGMKLLGLFVPQLRELPEMMYQYDRDYVFDSSKFQQRFQFEPTPYSIGITETIRAFQQQEQ